MNIEDIEFKIDPYKSVGPLKFGMTKNEVEKILGKSDTSTKDFLGRTDERRGNISVKYNNKGKVNEVSFWDGAKVFFQNHDILNEPTISKILNEIEKPFSTVGYKVYFSIGIAITGFSKKKDDKTVSVFAKELEPMWKM